MDFVFAQKNAARCISEQNKKNILAHWNLNAKGIKAGTAFFVEGIL